MEDEERDKLAQETHQALLGIPGTEEKGLVGDVKEIKAHLDDHSKRLTIMETQRKMSKKALTGYISGGAGIIVALWKAFTGS